MVQVVILAGGLATRLRPITEKIPKGMVPVLGRPFLEHQISLLKKNSVKEIVLCLGYKGEVIEEYFGDGAKWGVSIGYSYDGDDDKLLGTGGALKKASKLLNKDFFVLYGDSYLDVDYRAIFSFYKKMDPLALMTVFHNKGLFDKSNVVFKNGKLLVYDKKNPTSDMEYIDYGLSILKKESLLVIPEEEKCFDLAFLYTKLVAEGKMAGYEVHERFYEIGTAEALKEFEKYLKRTTNLGG